MADGLATGGPRHWPARRARGRRQRWLSGIVERVGSGELDAPPGSALAVVAAHRDADGGLLDLRPAAVELPNVVRPTTAVPWFVAFSGHALARWPQYSRLARLPFDVPADQDLTISLRRIPARPASGVVLRPAR